MTASDCSKSPLLVPIIRTREGSEPVVIDRIDVNESLFKILRALIEEDFGGLRLTFRLGLGYAWQFDANTPAGAFFDWLYHCAKLGHQLPHPESAVTFLRGFLDNRGGPA